MLKYKIIKIIDAGLYTKDGEKVMDLTNSFYPIEFNSEENRRDCNSCEYNLYSLLNKNLCDAFHQPCPKNMKCRWTNYDWFIDCESST